ncbi:MAG: hypothetical protein UX38_C0022G0001, partial [Microgenomates group bacterium GW2011_GWC1_46_16]
YLGESSREAEAGWVGLNQSREQ